MGIFPHQLEGLASVLVFRETLEKVTPGFDLRMITGQPRIGELMVGVEKVYASYQALTSLGYDDQLCQELGLYLIKK